MRSSDENKSSGYDYYYVIQNWLGLAFCFVCILLLRVFKYVGNEKNKVIDDKLRSASDFAIKV